VKTQRQRRAATEVRDFLDFKACMERNDWICQVCGRQAGQLHHGRGKALSIRHDRRYHYAVCQEPCHRKAHDYPKWWKKWMNANPNEE